MVAEHKSGKVSAGDVGNAEKVLGNKAEDEAECKRVYGNASVIAPDPCAQMRKGFADDYGDDGKADEICDDAYEYRNGLNRRIGKAGEHGKYDDAEHVVNYGRSHYCSADAAFEFSHLAQSLNGYRNGGRGKDNAYECGLEHTQAVRLAVKQQVAAGTAQERNYNADRCNDKGRKAGVLKLLNVGIKSGGEH